MCRPPPLLEAGYARFLENSLPAARAWFERSREQQTPKVALIGCIDSRTNPATLFDARPGEMLIIRNTANLVPAFGEEGGLQATGAALELAVTRLGVEHLVVKGHSRCGGIAACIETARGTASASPMIDGWTRLARPSLDEIHSEAPHLEGAAFADAVGQRSVIRSLERLMTYPFVAAAVAENRLHLHGAWFAIGEVELFWLDREAGRFRPASGNDHPA